MIKVKIVLDEEKILIERKYSIKKIWNVIDEAFASKNIRIEEKGLYAGTNHPHDFANIGLVCSELGSEDWFLYNLLEWKYYTNEYSDNSNEFYEEDLLLDTKFYKAGFR